jgi:CRISPR/Cas system CSM-associated protein Csm2 small subunit
MIPLNKKLPIALLREMKDFLPNNKLCSILESDNFIFHVVDNDATSGFYFVIEKYSEKAGYLLNYKPKNINSTAHNFDYVEVKDIKTHFNIWYNCLLEYAELEIELKDPFLKNLEDQFLDGLNLEVENKNEPLTLKEIFLIEGHLSTIIDEIKNYKNEENSAQIEEIVEEATNLRSDLGNQTKERIAKGFSSILAKITKEGPEILKGIFKEAGKQLMTHGVKFLLDHGEKLIT